MITVEEDTTCFACGFEVKKGDNLTMWRSPQGVNLCEVCYVTPGAIVGGAGGPDTLLTADRFFREGHDIANVRTNLILREIRKNSK